MDLVIFCFLMLMFFAIIGIMQQWDSAKNKREIHRLEVKLGYRFSNGWRKISGGWSLVYDGRAYNFQHRKFKIPRWWRFWFHYKEERLTGIYLGPLILSVSW